jgi:hypothetical protein
MLRALYLLRVLGFWRFEIFGFDSCITDDEHHAYSQPENDGMQIITVTTTDGRMFRCNPWMVSQAQEFCDQIGVMGDEFEMIVYGDGLIAHLLKTGAEIEDSDNEETDNGMGQAWYHQARRRDA